MVYEGWQKRNPRTKHKAGQENNMRYSHEDIARKINEFQRKGGLILKLREETTPGGINVLPKDPRNYGPYEPVGVSESGFSLME